MGWRGVCGGWRGANACSVDLSGEGELRELLEE